MNDEEAERPLQSRNSETPNPGRHRGIALVMVLWVLMLLALVAASFSHTTRTEVNLARNLVESSKAEALAEAGVYHAVLGLLGQAGEDTWRVDGSVYAWRFGGGEIRVAIQDEGGKVDLNSTAGSVLRDLFLSLDLELNETEALVDAILDYRDSDDLKHVSGAEDPDYQAADLEHDAKDAPFELVEELQQVYGMTRAIYDRVAPALTVYSRLRRPFAATAPPEVRAILPASLGETSFLESDEEDTEGEEPDEDPEEGLSETPRIIVKGNSEARSRVRVYTIHSEALLPSGAVFALEAVTRLTGSPDQPYGFHRWRRAGRHLFEDSATLTREGDDQ